MAQSLPSFPGAARSANAPLEVRLERNGILESRDNIHNHDMTR